MKHTGTLLVVASLLTLGCRSVPGQEVRFQPTPMPAVRAMLELAEVGPGDVVFDLGSGDGRIPITAALEFGARGVGIEIDPVLVARAQSRAEDAGVEHRVEFRLGDMYAADVQSATVVTLFLHPEPNLKLRPMLLSQLPPGSRVVSYVWDMGDWGPDEVRRVNRRQIFLWRIPARAPPPVGKFAEAERPPESGRSLGAIQPPGAPELPLVVQHRGSCLGAAWGQILIRAQLSPFADCSGAGSSRRLATAGGVPNRAQSRTNQDLTPLRDALLPSRSAHTRNRLPAHGRVTSSGRPNCCRRGECRAEWARQTTIPR